MKLKIAGDLQQRIEQLLSILNPEFRENKKEGCFEVTFTVADARYLCMQLFQFGGKVEIVEPGEVRDVMVGMLEEGMGVYRR